MAEAGAYIRWFKKDTFHRPGDLFEEIQGGPRQREEFSLART